MKLTNNQIDAIIATHRREYVGQCDYRDFLDSLEEIVKTLKEHNQNSAKMFSDVLGKDITGVDIDSLTHTEQHIIAELSNFQRIKKSKYGCIDTDDLIDLLYA